jgi:uncharacterized protein with GYD domain
MPAYITLCKFTQQGLANIKASPERTRQAKEAAKKMGGRYIGVWWTMGEYDLVVVGEGPDDQTMMLSLLQSAGLGNVTTTTMRAFSEEEFAQIVAKLP